MFTRIRPLLLGVTALFCGVAAFFFVPAAVARAASPTPKEALQLKPVQEDVDYDTPKKEDIAKCSIQIAAFGGVNGYVVYDQGGQVLRRFLDVNKDRKIDQWCYYKNGIEVYRDIDANYNEKTDQYRWFGTAGSRWGIDIDEDRRIDSWRMLSAEEATAELVAAIRTRDGERFKRLLLTERELDSLGINKEKKAKLKAKIDGAAKSFSELARRQKIVDSAAQWVHFGGGRPGVVPAGTDGLNKDLFVYDNVSTVFESKGKASQLAVGSLVRLGEVWRLIDLPANLLEGRANAVPEGFFFQATLTSRPAIDPSVGTGLSKGLQKLIARMEELDKQLISAAPAQLSKLNAQRADLIEEMAEAAANDQEREIWLRQLADSLGAAVQSEGYPDGLKRLQKLSASFKKEEAKSDVAAYVKYRSIAASYSQGLQDSKSDTDYVKIAEQWMKDLEEFAKDFPKSEDAPEAMRELGVSQEFAGKEDEAKRWYSRIATEYSSSPAAEKATGAKRRLESIGKTMVLKGKTVDGKNVDLAAYRGKMVLIHYWATWNGQCKEDLEILKNMQAKYGRQGLAVLGVNHDSDAGQLRAYLKTNRFSWPQLYEQGGLDNRFAKEMGIMTLPTMLLIDKSGRVIHRNVYAGDLDKELGKRLR